VQEETAMKLVITQRAYLFRPNALGHKRKPGPEEDQEGFIVGGKFSHQFHAFILSTYIFIFSFFISTLISFRV